MYYALNCGERGIEIYSADRKPKLKKPDVATKLMVVQGKETLLRIIKIGLKGGKLIGNWSPYHAKAVFGNTLGEPGTLSKVSTPLVIAYNASYNRVDKGA